MLLKSNQITGVIRGYKEIIENLGKRRGFSFLWIFFF